MAKVIVAGSRNIDDERIVWETVQESPHSPFNGELITGGAEGVDAIAKERIAEKHTHVDYKEFEADWEQYGNRAGPIRNKKMAQYADALIAIWDGQSTGTKDMIQKAIEYNLDIYLKVVESEQESLFDF
jgi:hypothetical protein